MAEEPAVGYDGFEAAAGAGAGAVGAEDNLSMSLGDFMAFLETEPAPPGEGGEEEEEEQQPGRISWSSSGFKAGTTVAASGASLEAGLLHTPGRRVELRVRQGHVGMVIIAPEEFFHHTHHHHHHATAVADPIFLLVFRGPCGLDPDVAGQVGGRVNQGCMEIAPNTNGSEDLFQSHEEMLENIEVWSNYTHVDPSECQVEVNMELNEGEQTIDHSESSPYVLINGEKWKDSDIHGNQSGMYNLDNQHVPRDASNHANFEEATGPPHELSNGSYLGQRTIYDQTELQVENNEEGMKAQMNTYFSGGISTEQSALSSEIQWENADEMLGNTSQDGDRFTSMAMFSLTHNADVPDISCTGLNMGEPTESIYNGNSSCLTLQEEHRQGEYGNYHHPDYISVDMVGEGSLHDFPQNNEQYEMDQFPQDICESETMQMGSPDQYCDDTSLSDIYMDVSSPESISFEQNQSEDICFKSESSTDSSPVPSSRNSTTEDADKSLGHTSKQFLDSKFVPFNNQHPVKKLGYQRPLILQNEYGYRSNNSSIQGSSSRGCFSIAGNGSSDFGVLQGNRNSAPDDRLLVQGKFHRTFQQPMYGSPILPTFGGMRYKPHDERITLQLALQDISQPKSEANPPDGLLAVPLLRHQKIALSWMVQKETSSPHCSGGILADDQGLGKTVSTISLILTERPPVPQSSTIKKETFEAVTLDDDDEDDCDEPDLKKQMQTCSSELTSNTVKQENPIVSVKTRPAAATMLDGKPIISLPPKTVSLKTVDFTSEERNFYNTLEVESREQFKKRSWFLTNIWILQDAPEDAVVTICGHVFCNQCILEQLTGDDSICPVSNCRVRLNSTSLFSRGTLECSLSGLTCDFKSNDTSMEMVHGEKRPGIDSSYASSKVRAALDILLSLPKIDPTQTMDSKNLIGLASENFEGKGSSEQADTKLTEKAIVFSQWTRMLDLLEVHLKASHVTYRRLDGTMSVAARDKAVKDFNTVPEVTVMIMSLKAASLGLNMVAACHVLMLDLWWNPTTEDQAVDRAHRIGQTRPVTVSRLTIKDTVEDRILALQEKKREMVASAFGEDRSGSRQSRLTVEDLNYLFMV
nr:unnamed protein product [Digitaria exilis]